MINSVDEDAVGSDDNDLTRVKQNEGSVTPSFLA